MKAMPCALLFFVLTLTISQLLFTGSVTAQWIRQNSGTSTHFTDVYFINLQTGWACGQNKIFKTTNGGINWTMQPNPAQNYIRQIHAVDSNNVYAAGYFTILKTTNGGENWIGIMTGTYGSGLPAFEGLFFINTKTGWFCGSQQVRKTTDGGISFDSFYVGADLSDMYFRNEIEGVSSGPYVIRKTINGGINWNQINLPWQWQQQFNRVSFFDNHTGYIVGSSGITLRTTDFGNSWDSIGRIITPEIIYGSIFTSRNIGYAGGSFGVLFKTTNGGQSWGFQDTNTLGYEYIYSFWGYNDTVLRAVGGGGKIIYTTNGGKWLVGINNINENVPETFILHQNYPNPFNNSTIINFSINKSSLYSLKVFDLTGKLTNVLFETKLETGNYKTTFYPNNLSSGIYFYSLTNGKSIKTKKMIIVK